LDTDILKERMPDYQAYLNLPKESLPGVPEIQELPEDVKIASMRSGKEARAYLPIRDEIFNTILRSRKHCVMESVCENINYCAGLLFKAKALGYKIFVFGFKTITDTEGWAGVLQRARETGRWIPFEYYQTTYATTDEVYEAFETQSVQYHGKRPVKGSTTGEKQEFKETIRLDGIARILIENGVPVDFQFHTTPQPAASKPVAKPAPQVKGTILGTSQKLYPELEDIAKDVGHSRTAQLAISQYHSTIHLQPLPPGEASRGSLFSSIMAHSDIYTPIQKIGSVIQAIQKANTPQQLPINTSTTRKTICIPIDPRHPHTLTLLNLVMNYARNMQVLVFEQELPANELEDDDDDDDDDEDSDEDKPKSSRRTELNAMAIGSLFKISTHSMIFPTDKVIYGLLPLETIAQGLQFALDGKINSQVSQIWTRGLPRIAKRNAKRFRVISQSEIIAYPSTGVSMVIYRVRVLEHPEFLNLPEKGSSKFLYKTCTLKSDIEPEGLNRKFYIVGENYQKGKGKTIFVYPEYPFQTINYTNPETIKRDLIHPVMIETLPREVSVKSIKHLFTGTPAGKPIKGKSKEKLKETKQERPSFLLFPPRESTPETIQIRTPDNKIHTLTKLFAGIRLTWSNGEWAVMIQKASGGGGGASESLRNRFIAVNLLTSKDKDPHIYVGPIFNGFNDFSKLNGVYESMTAMTSSDKKDSIIVSAVYPDFRFGIASGILSKLHYLFTNHTGKISLTFDDVIRCILPEEYTLISSYSPLILKKLLQGIVEGSGKSLFLNKQWEYLEQIENLVAFVPSQLERIRFMGIRWIFTALALGKNDLVYRGGGDYSEEFRVLQSVLEEQKGKSLDTDLYERIYRESPRPPADLSHRRMRHGEDFGGFIYAREQESLVHRGMLSRSTNPKYVSRTHRMDHFITNLGDPDQIQTECLKQWWRLSRGGFQILPKSLGVGVPGSSILYPILKSAEEKMSHDLHAGLRPDDVIQSLVYGFFRLRTTIFVSFRGGRLAIFRPLVNTQFKHTFPLTNEFWFGKSEMSAEDDYLEDKNERIRSRLYKENTREELFDDRRLWFANNCLVGNIISENFTGDQFVPVLLHMLREVSYRHLIPDCDFLVNTRDYPKLRKDLGDPDHCMYGLPADNSKPMPEYLPRGKCIPILGFNTSMYYNDIGLPVPDDWKIATGLYYGKEGRNQKAKPQKLVEESLTPENWDSRKPQAVFRGSATGPEITDSENQRLKLAMLSTTTGYTDLLNVGITSWAFRDKKTDSENGMGYIIPGETTGIKLSSPMPLWGGGGGGDSQDSYRMVVYVDGNAAAYRYSSLMATGFCIVKVESKHGFDMWFYPALKPAIQTRPIVNPEDDSIEGYEVIEESWNEDGDHLPVKADMEDLRVILEWAQKPENKEKTRKIALNSFKMYQSLFTRQKMCQYIHLLLQKIAIKEPWRAPEDFVSVAGGKDRDRDVLIPFEDTLAAHSLRNAYEREYEIMEEQEQGLEGYQEDESDEDADVIGITMPGDETFRLKGSEEVRYQQMLPNPREVLERASVETSQLSPASAFASASASSSAKTSQRKHLPKPTKNLSRMIRELGMDEDEDVSI
jgi:hypothetical protein